MKLIFATGNKGKLREAAEILTGCELLTPADFGITDDIEETGITFKENSIIKARYIYERTGMDCFADDTGLEVDCLGGAPGVYSARYAGEGHDFAANIEKLLCEMGSCENRKARFRNVVTLILGGKEYYFEGLMEGRIALEPRGTKGFGYDPVFIADEHPEGTMGELGPELKNEISHRGKSLRAMAEFIASLEK